MRFLPRCLAAALTLAASSAAAADANIVTIADGSARVLRGTVWYKLAAGAPFQDGDVIEAGERTTVQVELASGATFNLVGPGAFYGASIPPPGTRDALELWLERGWLKAAVPAGGAGARVRTPVALMAVNEAIVVAHQENRLFELFVELGGAKLTEAGRAGRDGPPGDARSGEYWWRDGDRAFVSERRAPIKFVTSMPRHQVDKLAVLAPKYKGAKPPALAVDREISLAEADSWLAGPYRRTFARRFAGRLADPGFRKAVEANIAMYPDFDRALHPEKYPASPAATAASGLGVPPPAAVGGSPGAAPPSTTPPAPAPASVPAKPGIKSGLLHWSPILTLLLRKTPEALL